MMNCKISVALFCLMSLAITIPANANNKPEDYLNAHNQARAAQGIGPMTWDNKLADYAKNYLNQRTSDCSYKADQCDGRYGQNTEWSKGDLGGGDTVKKWVGEKEYYDYTSNSCKDGKECGRYTQVVWRDSVRLGCARAKCKNGGTMVMCKYDPPGNIYGKKPN